jgi:hypothetical protein
MEHKKYKYKRKRSTVPVSDHLPEAGLIFCIENWRSISGESVADFGRNSCGDTKIWYELLAGRRLHKSTRERIFTYFAEKTRAHVSTLESITEGNLNG